MREPARARVGEGVWLVALPLWLVLASPGAAQLPSEYPVIAATPAGEGCPGPPLWAAPSAVPELGLVDIWLYPHARYGPVPAGRFGVTWPAEWSLQEIEVCQGTLLEGGISSPPAPVSLDHEGSGSDGLPSVRLRFDATVPGRFSITRNPLTDEYRWRFAPGGEWVEYDGADFQIFYFVEVGPLVCAWPLGGPEDYCGLFVEGRSLTEAGAPESFSIPLGGSHSETVTSYDGGECLADNYCTSTRHSYTCRSQPYSLVPWVTFDFIDEPTPGTRRFRRTIDTVVLSTGNYVGAVGDSAQCVRCGRGCHEVRLTVLPPRPVESTSWGRIKATYRGEDEAPDREEE